MNRYIFLGVLGMLFVPLINLGQDLTLFPHNDVNRYFLLKEFFKQYEKLSKQYENTGILSREIGIKFCAIQCEQWRNTVWFKELQLKKFKPNLVTNSDGVVNNTNIEYLVTEFGLPKGYDDSGEQYKFKPCIFNLRFVDFRDDFKALAKYNYEFSSEDIESPKAKRIEEMINEMTHHCEQSSEEARCAQRRILKYYLEEQEGSVMFLPDIVVTDDAQPEIVDYSKLSDHLSWLENQ